jgi:hypothetical protein
MNHDRLNKAAAEIAEWNAKLFKLREDISTAETALAESQRRRQSHVLEAALGDDDAKSRLAEVLEDDRRAQRALEDLRQALPVFESRLREAEAAQKDAEAEWRKAEVHRLARERVAAAEKIDAALASFNDAWIEYTRIGQQLFSASIDRQDQLYLAENFDGLKRLASALPHQPFHDIRWKHSFAQLGGGAPLAISESQFWRLPPVEAVKAA